MTGGANEGRQASESVTRGGLWLAALRFAAQVLSWAATVLVARILVPSDYGLVELAIVLTGLVELFSELGLGAAIVQRKTPTHEELSSVFWLSCGVGLLLTVGCVVASFPIAWAFDEPRMRGIVQVAAIGFLVGSTMVVPFNLLVRDCRFRAIGGVQFVAAALSSSAMLAMAMAGFGPWTLVLGTVLLRAVTVMGSFAAAGWRPSWIFRLPALQPYVRYGLSVVATRSLYFLFQKSDRLIVGSVLGIETLGLYSFARHLAALPNDKVISLVNQISFPVLSRYQADDEAVRRIYLQTVRSLSVGLAPVFLSGAIFGEELVGVVLGDRWLPLAGLFRLLCLGQFIVAVTSINSVVHNAQGRPHWVLYVTLASTAVQLISVYLAAQWGLLALAVPWAVVYPAGCVVFAVITMRRIGVSPARVVAELRPTAAAAAASAAVGFGLWTLTRTGLVGAERALVLGALCAATGFAYAGYLLLFERETAVGLVRMFRSS